ncbi:hypothetical protein [Bradyrhizobium sp. LA7.1]|uniref:hypothetical protein n=1 Tax=Bradyrhizobium sp. LA7.1 TaxID=3156324 RepID=UPI00339A85C4
MSRPTRNTRWGCLCLLTLVGLWPCCARAQQERPFQFITLDCLFRGALITTMEKGKLTTTVPNDTLSITLTNFNYENHTAIMIGNAGSDEVSFIPSSKKAVLVQLSATGNGFMTSVSEPVGGKAIAFHSRHSWLFGEPLVSEYQADCKVRK